jgi:hypothetical protein
MTLPAGKPNEIMGIQRAGQNRQFPQGSFTLDSGQRSHINDLSVSA